MSRLQKIVLVLILLAAAAAPAWSQMAAPPPPPALAPVAVAPPLAPGVNPAWVAVPNSPRVFYAPNTPVDLFRVHKRYYYYSGSSWYGSKHLAGPWRPVRKLPRAVYRVNRTYFKTPPPW